MLTVTLNINKKFRRILNGVGVDFWMQIIWKVSQASQNEIEKLKKQMYPFTLQTYYEGANLHLLCSTTSSSKIKRSTHLGQVTFQQNLTASLKTSVTRH